MTEKKAGIKKTKYEKRLEKEERILAELKERAKNPDPKIVAIRNRIARSLKKIIPSGVSLADELIADRRKEEI